MRKTTPRSKAVGKAKITRRNAKLKTIPWDVTKYFRSEADIANYLKAAFEEGDPTLVAAAFDDVARAKASRKSRIKPATRA